MEISHLIHIHHKIPSVPKTTKTKKGIFGACLPANSAFPKKKLEGTPLTTITTTTSSLPI
jgi:hypothetical protein